MSGKKGRSGGRNTTNGKEHIRTKENAERICELLRRGVTLRNTALELGVHHASIQEWVEDERARGGVFASQYARARAIGYENLAEELLVISDGDIRGPDGKPDNAIVQQRRLMSDNRKWLLSKALPRIYGDRVTTEVVGDADRPLVTRIELVPVDPIVQAALSRPTIEHDDGED